MEPRPNVLSQTLVSQFLTGEGEQPGVAPLTSSGRDRNRIS